MFYGALAGAVAGYVLALVYNGVTKLLQGRAHA